MSPRRSHFLGRTAFREAGRSACASTRSYGGVSRARGPSATEDQVPPGAAASPPFLSVTGRRRSPPSAAMTRPASRRPRRSSFSRAASPWSRGTASTSTTPPSARGRLNPSRRSPYRRPGLRAAPMRLLPLAVALVLLVAVPPSRAEEVREVAKVNKLLNFDGCVVAPGESCDFVIHVANPYATAMNATNLSVEVYSYATIEAEAPVEIG